MMSPDAMKARIAQLETLLARYINPLTIEILNTETRRWEPYCHDAPITREQAEERVKIMQENSPRAIFRIVPWLDYRQWIHSKNSK